MDSNATDYRDIRQAIAELEIVDCHEHILRRERTEDILVFLASFYMADDFRSAVGEVAAAEITDPSRPLDDRWPRFSQAWDATRFTGYGLGTRTAIERLFGTDEISLENLHEWQERMPDFSEPSAFDRWITDAKIVASVSDNWPDPGAIWNGTFTPLPWQRLAISLPGLHSLTRRKDIEPLEQACGRTVTSLGEYVKLCGDLFERWIAAGAVAMKDQSAYTRTIGFDMPSEAEAERVFNRILSDGRYAAEYDPEQNPLSDFLMHAFMRLARDLNLPVQLHTGHMAGQRNDVRKANAAGLRSLLETHRDVRFDLFHANWPFAGDILFLAKNYSNVSIDMCWAYAIDPVYSRDFLERAVMTVPYTKIHGFGSDLPGTLPHMVWAYSEVARDVIASALAGLVGDGHLSMTDAESVAAAWLHGNPTRFFGLDRSPGS